MSGRNGLLGAIIAQAILSSINNQQQQQPCDNPKCDNPRCHELRKLLENGVNKPQEEPKEELLGNRDPATLEADLVILKQAQAIFEREAELTKTRASAEGFPLPLAEKAREIYNEQRLGLRLLKQLAGMLELRLLTSQGSPVDVTLEFVSV